MRCRTLSVCLVLFAAGACYSVEFVPAAGYANLRRSADAVRAQQIEIVYTSPGPQIRRLGVLSIRDVSDPRSPDFAEFVVKEARRRGAPAAWIQADAMRRVPHDTFGSWLRPGDGIGIVPVVLYEHAPPR